MRDAAPRTVSEQACVHCALKPVKPSQFDIFSGVLQQKYNAPL
jgi:hypothetical protein